MKRIIQLFFILLPFISMAQKWEMKKAPLMTSYSKDVNPDQVLPEYPRPQMVREQWMNLNGLWQFQPGTSATETLPTGSLSRTILVPFPVESALSGVMEHHERLWYRRSFTIPSKWQGQKIILHFGAVDYESEVYINGKSLGIHQGGYDPFSLDITPFLNKEGKQELTVRVLDSTDNEGYPRGKQTLNPQGIMYTSVTGIWQTVWLEPVPQTNISSIKLVPDIDQSVLKLTVFSDAINKDTKVSVSIKDGNKTIQKFTGATNNELSIPVPNANLWSPSNPFLYNLEIKLEQNGKQIDQIGSYFGMRKISVQDENGIKKLYLNNKFLFQMGPLDQGFWPDGGYTAPTDEALSYDLKMIKAFGFNMVRKHIKVEPYRWYYWADKLGLMVWQDMPSANSYTEKVPPVEKEAYKHQLQRLVETHLNCPCIVMWVIFNEGQGQHDTKELCNMVKKLDPSRLINQASGGGHFDAGDMMDIHSYPPPACPESKTQVLACGEYGGIGYIIDGHIWKSGLTYIMKNSEKEVLDLYSDFSNQLTMMKTNSGLSAAVYTEITDVETELNGLLTYDRAIAKIDPAKIKKCNETAIYGHIYVNEVVPSSKDKGYQWKYTFEKPADNWFAASYTDSTWKTGKGGFGTTGTPGAVIGTEWKTNDVWLRRDIELGNLSSQEIQELVLSIHHDDDCTVYMNGVLAADLNAYTSGYVVQPISTDAKKTIKPNAKNTIAIHCHQIQGGQFIDAGLSLIK